MNNNNNKWDDTIKIGLIKIVSEDLKWIERNWTYSECFHIAGFFKHGCKSSGSEKISRWYITSNSPGSTLLLWY
jgi:hypothetical protein